MTHRWLLSIGFSLLFAVGLLGCGSDATDGAPSQEPTFTKEGTLTFARPDGAPITTIDIEIADTNREREQGLMRRRSLGFERGMLFIFEAVNEDGMWMKNTPLPLDIVFVAPDSTVINIVERTKPFSLDPIRPTAPKKYVVEVRAGFVDRHNLTDSTRIRWQRTPAS
jgi:hypothetical protein